MAPKLLNILLQRNDSNIQWGFRLSGGKDFAKPLTIVKVFPGTLASQYFVPGDIVLGIQGYSSKDLLHVEAVDLVRDPGKSLELLVQKCEVPLDNQNNELPASIWGPENVLQRPSDWLRRSPSPFARNLIDPKPAESGYRSLNTIKQQFESANQSEPTTRTGYTPTALDNKLRQQFERTPDDNMAGVPQGSEETRQAYRAYDNQLGVPQEPEQIRQAYRTYDNQTGMPQGSEEIRQAYSVNQVSSVTQHISCENHQNADIYSQRSQYDSNVYQQQEMQQMPFNTQEITQRPEKLQVASELQRASFQKSSKTTIVEQRVQAQTSIGIQKNVSSKVESVVEKQRISATADILKRPISPEFNVFPNGRGGSLLKLVLSKSLGNYSPHDFEKMRATETYEETEEEDDDDTEEDSESSDDEDEEEEEEETDDEDGGENDDGESQEEYVRYMSCESDGAISSPGGSMIFDRYWMVDNDEGAMSDDSELAQQCPRSRSVSRASSRASAASPFRGATPTPMDDRGRQSSQLSGGDNTPSPGPPSAPASGDGVTENNTAPSFPAPPPPPPPAPCSLPTVRLSTEIPDTRRGGGYEPPAAIQNAMMTKDKKPFTYTPGGLDLSQIRSPRMQRRITRNANAEGVGEHPQAAGPKTSPLAQPPPQGPLPPSAMAAMQPQMAVPVFPTGGSGGVHLHHVNTPPGNAPPPPPPPPVVEPLPVAQSVSNAMPKPTVNPVIRPVQSPMPKAEPPKPVPTVAKSPPVSPPAQMQNEPGSIYVPPVTTRAQVGSLYIPPITNNTQPEPVTSPQRPQAPQTPMSPLPTLNKAPTPWMSQHQRQQQQQNVPPWMHREEPQQQTAGGTRIIPIQVEGRSEPVQPPQPPQPPQPQSQASNQQQTRIIPIQIEGTSTTSSSTSTSSKQTQQRRPVYVHNKFNPPTSPTSPAPNNHTDSQSEQNARQYQHQQSWGPPGGNGGPIQSRSFRVLQKITDTDNTESESELPAQEYGPPNSGGGHWNSQQGVPVQQMHKLQLNDDDRALMNKFRAQVDEDSFLHTESDPRYRGAAIPSRAFRMLQNMTDGMADYSEQVPRGPGMPGNPQARPVSVQQVSSGDGPPQAYIPPSEQQVQEPRKYTGGAIPSRSFRMLQAMTAPENCGPGQSDM